MNKLFLCLFALMFLFCLETSLSAREHYHPRRHSSFNVNVDVAPRYAQVYQAPYYAPRAAIRRPVYYSPAPVVVVPSPYYSEYYAEPVYAERYYAAPVYVAAPAPRPSFGFSFRTGW